MEIEINFQLVIMWYVVLLIHELGHVIANKLIGAELVYVNAIEYPRYYREKEHESIKRYQSPSGSLHFIFKQFS